MNFKEIDNLIGSRLNNRFGSTERRDYKKLENKRPDIFKGYGNKQGLMYLTTVSYDLYVDVNIFENYFTLVFRKDDDDLIEIDSRKHMGRLDFIGGNNLLYYFLQLIDEYLYVEQRFNLFNSGTIPTDLERAKKIDSILN